MRCDEQKGSSPFEEEVLAYQSSSSRSPKPFVGSLHRRGYVREKLVFTSLPPLFHLYHGRYPTSTSSLVSSSRIEKKFLSSSLGTCFEIRCRSSWRKKVSNKYNETHPKPSSTSAFRKPSSFLPLSPSFVLTQAKLERNRNPVVSISSRMEKLVCLFVLAHKAHQSSDSSVQLVSLRASDELRRINFAWNSKEIRRVTSFFSSEERKKRAALPSFRARRCVFDRSIMRLQPPSESDLDIICSTARSRYGRDVVTTR